jgi:hypothetical protein
MTHIDVMMNRAANRSRFHKKNPSTNPIPSAMKLPNGMRQSAELETQ